MLDSPIACVEELAAVNKEIAEFGHKWAVDAGELKSRLKRYDRLYRAGLLGTRGDLKVAERDATAHAAVEEVAPGLAESIEALEGQVEGYKTRFKALERRASNAQSILSALKSEAKIGEHVVPEPSWSWER